MADRTDDFAAVDRRLRGILELEGKPWGYVVGTRLGKRYVTFSPELRRRKQGK